MQQYRDRIQAILNEMTDWRYTNVQTLEPRWVCEADYRLSETFEKEGKEWKPFRKAETWGGADKHFWFYSEVTLSKEYEGEKVVLRISTGATDIWNTNNPQFLIYVNGHMAATMDMNHHTVTLSEQAKEGERYEIAVYAYSNLPMTTNFLFETIAVLRPDVEKLYYDIKVPFEAAELMREDEIEREETLSLLNRTLNCLDLRIVPSEAFYESVAAATAFLEQGLYENADKRKSPVTVHSVGHTHIDVAWKWPLRQTRQKTVRSFQTVLNLMKEYPEYRFMSSQPQLYQFIKEDAPWLYEQIKERVKEGRWEPEGAMWLEADCNITSGESLIRQILYGKQFFEQEFGIKEQEVLWLPDVFGYSVALPQILKKSGIRYFMTTKIAWNEYNQMPNDTMMWRGLDGSEVLTYFISTTNYNVYPELIRNAGFNTTYNGRQNVSQVKGTWQRFQNKELTKDVLTCYGYGDGGGGPTAEMLEESRRMEKGICGCPITRQTSVREFFHILEENIKESEREGKKLPRWCGELYLEFHRGTYTSIAKNKKNNRKCEFLNADAEFLSVLADVLQKQQGKSFAYPKEALDEAWKLVLLNQFHDILPGSSIKDVYEDSDIQYARVYALDEEMIEKAENAIAEVMEEEENADFALAVYNSLSFERDGFVELPWEENACFVPSNAQKTEKGTLLYPLPHKVAAKGVTLYREEKGEKQASEEAEVMFDLKMQEGRLAAFETSFYRIVLNAEGEFASIYDKEAEREVLLAGEVGNRLRVYEDRPLQYNAWNIDAYYEEKSWDWNQVEEIKLVENGPVRAVFVVRRRFLHSTLEQRVCFYRHTRRIDFETVVDWKEEQLLLKAEFPIDVTAARATYEVQFGNVERPTHKNTSWDEAKFEVCAQKWADLSECGYGAAILNDCKYGCDIHDSLLRLTLIKSGIFPNPDADKEEHRFTYSFYPHMGDFREGRVVMEAYDLNCPLTAKRVKGGKAVSYSFLELSVEHVLADTLKRAEDNEGWVLRMYEAYGKRAKVSMRLPLLEAAIKEGSVRIWECDCMEKAEQEVLAQDGHICFDIRPYEIKTWKIQPVTERGGQNDGI